VAKLEWKSGDSPGLFRLQFTSNQKQAEGQRVYGNTDKHHGQAKDSGFEPKSFHSRVHAKAAFVKKGDRVKVINTHGVQVVDCWATNPDNLGEYMSLEHCRLFFERVCSDSMQ